ERRAADRPWLCAPPWVLSFLHKAAVHLLCCPCYSPGLALPGYHTTALSHFCDRTVTARSRLEPCLCVYSRYGMRRDTMTPHTLPACAPQERHGVPRESPLPPQGPRGGACLPSCVPPHGPPHPAVTTPALWMCAPHACWENQSTRAPRG